VRFQASFPAVPLGVGAVRGEMTAIARKCGLDELGVSDVALAVSEATTNAVVHSRASQIEVTAVRDDGRLTIVIADDGVGMSPRPDSPGMGLGLPIIATVTERFEIVSREGRTEVHMTFHCPADLAA
jgi:anti-sigma regulatory factor (Ser/Thr protein kinase)